MSQEAAREESRFLTVCLRVPGVQPGNNPIKRSNRKAVAARSDGGGDRSGKGMGANSILFTNIVTGGLRAGASLITWCWLRQAAGRRALQPGGNERLQGRGMPRTACGPSMRMRPPANTASKPKNSYKLSSFSVS